MPPQLQNLLQNRSLLIGVIVGVVILAVVGFMLIGKGGGSKARLGEPLDEKQKVLATVDNLGKAIEIQALLAREGIQVDREDADGGKASIKLGKDATTNDRDQALITLVQSGLMDKNIGLEAFDKGDLTASREEKRIKLIRAQQGELARLIRKISPIQDASVSLSIPEQTIFKSEQKPMSASVQVTLANGERLTRDKIRSIINLMVGSIEGLDAQHVALADTNGNTYNSVLDVGSELNDKLEEQDQYMKDKVTAQLNKLMGPGNFVVTVSTLLREAPKETMVQTFEPTQSAIVSRQTFNERLSSNSAGGNGGVASSLIPNGLGPTSTGNSNRGYNRNGTEVTYANAKTQWEETSVPGMIEDISIAVTLDKTHLPAGVSQDQIQRQLARAASPKVNPENVSIIETDFPHDTPLTIPGGANGSGDDKTWMLWAAGGVAFCLIAVFLLLVGRGGGTDQKQLLQTQQEVQQLRDFASQQQAQIQATQQQAQMLLESQRQQLSSGVSPTMPTSTLPVGEAVPQINPLQQTLNELQHTVQEESLGDEDLDLEIKTWIEST